jgi:MFS family permease
MHASFPTARRANATLAVLMLAYILATVDRQILSLMVGPIRHDLGITDFQLSLLQGAAFAVFYVTLGIPAGRLADKYSRKWIVAVGISLWSVMTAVCGLARSFTTLFLARMGVGVGEATLSPSAYSLLADSFPPQRLARAAGIFTMGIAFGAGLAYIVGGLVIHVVAAAETIDLPFFGAVRSWQAAFIVVSLPGVLVAALMLLIREPARQGLARGADDKPLEVSFDAVFRFMRERWRVYGGIFVTLCMMGTFGHGYINWYPTFLIRAYGMDPGDVGLAFGLIYFVFGSVGALAGALLSERLAARGFTDANLRVVFCATAGLIPLSAATLVPSPALALILAAFTTFFLSAYFGVAMTAIQIVTPNQMRAVVASLLLFFANICGIGIGASSVAFFTDYVFKNDMAVGWSLALLSIILTPCATLLIRSTWAPYRRLLQNK